MRHPHSKPSGSGVATGRSIHECSRYQKVWYRSGAPSRYSDFVKLRERYEKVSPMNPWKLIMDRVVVSRKEDEVFYAVALDEFRSGQVRPGLMAKALAESGGDERKG